MLYQINPIFLSMDHRFQKVEVTWESWRNHMTKIKAQAFIVLLKLMAALKRILTFLALSQYHKIKSLKVCKLIFQVCYSDQYFSCSCSSPLLHYFDNSNNQKLGSSHQTFSHTYKITESAPPAFQNSKQHFYSGEFTKDMFKCKDPIKAGGAVSLIFQVCGRCD